MSVELATAYITLVPSGKGIKGALEKELNVESIAKSEGAKASKGFSSAFDSIKANAGPIALAAAGAFVTFGVKAVAAFKDVALEAGRFANVTGLAVDDASRWIAVGDDIGVSSQTMETAFGKMNVEIGKGGAALRDFGIEVVKAKDGTVDANATFLNAIDVIKGIDDPTKKAAAGQAAFGRGWKEMAELIEMGSVDVVKAMGEVSDAQVVDAGELQKAKDLRASLDTLGDSVKDVAIDIGEQLTPAIIIVADMLSTLAPIVGDVAGFVGDAFVAMVDAAYDFGSGIADVVDALPFVDMADTIGPTLYEWEKLERATGELVAEFSKGEPTMDEFRTAMQESGHSVEEVSLATIEYRKQLDAASAATEGSTTFLDKWVDAGVAAAEEALVLDGVQAGLASAFEATRAANEELVQSMLDAIPKAFNYEKAVLALDSSYAAYEVQLLETMATQSDATVSDRDKEQAVRDLRTAELDNATAVADTAAAYATEMGAVDGSRQSIDLQIESLQAAQDKYPELREEIQTFIDKLYAIPTDITSNVAVVADQGAFNAINTALLNLGRDVYVNVRPRLGGVVNSMAGRFVPGGSNLLTSAGELSGSRGDEAILPLGDPARLRELLGNSRIGPRVFDALGVSGGSGGGGDSVTINHIGQTVTPGTVSAALAMARMGR